MQSIYYVSSTIAALIWICIFFDLYCLIFKSLRYYRQQPKNFTRDLKRLFLMPSNLFFDFGSNPIIRLPRWLLLFVWSLFSISCFVELWSSLFPFNAFLFAYMLIPFIVLACGLLPLSYPECKYLNETIEEELPADAAQALGVQLLYKLSQQENMSFADYLLWRADDFTKRNPSLPAVVLPNSYNAACISLLVAEAAAANLSFTDYVYSLDIELSLY